MPIDPFGLLGSAIANVVTDSLTAAMLALWNAGRGIGMGNVVHS